MAIYVDRIFPCVPDKRWPYDHACHMISDRDIYELNAFALSIGLKVSYLQKEKIHGYNHYDLNAPTRARALANGAIPLEEGFTFAHKVAELKLDKWIREHAKELGEEVHKAWVTCQEQAKNPKESHLLSYDKLDSWNRWVDDEIGMHIARHAILAYSRRGIEKHEDKKA